MPEDDDDDDDDELNTIEVDIKKLISYCISPASS